LVTYVNGESLAFLIISDITARKEAEALLLAVTGAEVGTWHWDVLTGELHWSDRCKQIFGIPPGAEMTQELFMAALPPEDRERAAAAAQLALGQHAECDIELPIHRPDGRRCWAVYKGRGYYAPDGTPLRMEGVALDITARKEAEAEIEKLYADLKQHAAKLDDANRELEAFSYSVSHDLRAPLRHIAGFVQLLKQEAGPGLSAGCLHHLNVISGAAARMGNLVDDLLAFSRVSRVEMQKTEVDLAGLVREVLGELAAETRDRKITWEIHALPVVPADRGLLRLVLANLLGNAVKFTGTRAEARIEVGAAPGADPVIFVRDNGVGFDPKYTHKLFGVFQRLHSHAEFEGTGIGLANVQRIIHRHGGRVWAEGAVDGGATFYFSLPQPF
jgi:PAS domain S-box-containing protein